MFYANMLHICNLILHINIELFVVIQQESFSIIYAEPKTIGFDLHQMLKMIY